MFVEDLYSISKFIFLFQGYGVLPFDFISEFGHQIGRWASIYGRGGQVFLVTFTQCNDVGLLTTGWNHFLSSLALVGKPKVMLRYLGESFFVYKQDDQDSGNTGECRQTAVLHRASQKLPEVKITNYSLDFDRQVMKFFKPQLFFY